ncbi:MAG: BadF/BadG/BcrA/BcrD ATPase family protein [Thermodesulfobacteriota bacterium]|nr:BadF/BadG/BcrA/BcrD ATPase family protein [Thermodesulfobacteriota bacterium]
MCFPGVDIGSLSCNAVVLDEKKHIVLIDNYHRGIAARTNSPVKRVAKNADGLAVSMSGGVARNKGVVKAVTESMNIKKVTTPETPDINGALGAAIIAFERSI